MRSFRRLPVVLAAVCAFCVRAAGQELKHTAPAAEAVVAIEVSRSENGKPVVRRGGGMLLRCDGFVLAPAALFDPADGDQKIAVVLNPGTASERRVDSVKARGTSRGSRTATRS